MTDNFKILSNNASVAACVGALISACVSAWAAYTSYISAERIQNLQNQQQIISNINNASGQLVADGGRLISAINRRDSIKDLKIAKDQLTTLVAQQIQQAETVKVPLKLSEEDVIYYEDALSDFEHKTGAVNGVAEMPEWSQSFGHLLDVQRVLAQRLTNQKT